MIPGLFASFFADLGMPTLREDSPVNAYIFTGNNPSGNPFWSWKNWKPNWYASKNIYIVSTVKHSRVLAFLPYYRIGIWQHTFILYTFSPHCLKSCLKYKCDLVTLLSSLSKTKPWKKINESEKRQYLTSNHGEHDQHMHHSGKYVDWREKRFITTSSNVLLQNKKSTAF